LKLSQLFEGYGVDQCGADCILDSDPIANGIPSSSDGTVEIT